MGKVLMELTMSLDGYVAGPTSADGVRLIEQAGDGCVELERIRLAQSGQLTDLRFRVRDDGPGK